VRDHGPGFSDEDRPLVFERFYRSAAARAMPGAGLGLAIVREVAEAHGGEVEAENAADGGAVVRLSLDGAARTGTTEEP
jgi:two-component system sensor histidine kinase MprB